MSRRDLETLYGNRFAGSLEYRELVWATIVRHFFQRLIEPGATVLDLGGGYCHFINNVTCARKYVIDLNPTAQRAAAAGVTVLLQDSAQPWPVAPASVDVVFTSNFLEHLPAKTDVEMTIANVRAALRPGGRLIAMGPNIKFLPGEYWDFWDHALPITERSLAELLAGQGFVLERVEPRFLPYSMVAASRYPLFAVRAYLKMKWLWPLAGRQFLVIGRRPLRESSTPD